VSLAERRWLRLFTLCVLYVAQGIPWGFMATTLPSYLASHGVEDLGLVVSMTYLPYAFKWVWGPIIDAFTIPRFGRRRPWIVFAQGMMALTVFAMVTFDLTRNVQLLVQMIFIHTVFNAIQDVAVDALAVDLLPDNERGRANGLMYGSKYAGGALGGFGMAWLITQTSLNTALIAQTCVLLAIMLVPLLVRERDGAPPPREPVRAIAGALVQAFSLRSTLVAAVLMMFATLASGIMVPTATKLFVGELHWSVESYGAISGGWGLLVGGGGAAITGFLADRFGRKRVAALTSCGLAAGWIVAALMRSYWTETWFVWVIALYTEACLSIWSVSLFAIAMDLSWPRIAGSQFTVYMALLNVGTALGAQLSTRLMAHFEFHGVYIFGACLQLAITLLLVPIDLGETRRKLPLPEGQRPGRFALVSLFALLAVVVGLTIRAILKALA
jgi:MFS transporter, PAT family, beta-lactamase induction signal transducer AmpG